MVHLGRIVNISEAIAALREMGLRPATPHELIAKDAEEGLSEHPVAALGSIWKQYGRYDMARNAVCSIPSNDGLDLWVLDGSGFSEHFRFAAVPDRRRSPLVILKNVLGKIRRLVPFTGQSPSVRLVTA